MNPLWILAQTAPGLEANSTSPLESLILATGLMLAAAALMVLELLIISFGILGIGAAGCAVAGIVIAFQTNLAAGWTFLAITPIAAVLLGRWGLARLQRSSLVPQAEVTADAGAHHIAERIGASVGAIGTLATNARPGGRARFAGGECDVHVIGGALNKGTAIIIKSINGPTISVVAAPPPDSSDSPKGDPQ
ncbi:MAG: hypothetical protein PF961_18920 [Planctomycetota bacterium]|jgi:membrane-bound ClpP family serine protease|nr:hypothetical protein [Planctomycetota bacterium]